MVDALPQTWGYLLLALFALVFVSIGYLGQRRGSSESTEDFLIAREAFSAPIAVVSLVATWTWSSTVLGSAEGAIDFGAAALYVYGLVVPLSAVLLGVPILGRVRNLVPEASSFPEYIRLRFPDDWRGTASHLTFALVASSQMFFWAILQVLGAGVVLNVIFGIPHWQGALISGLIVTTYITFGGLRASIRTDIIQMVGIGVLIAVLLPWTIFAFGGPAKIYQGLANSDIANATSLLTEDVLYGWLLVSLLAFINYTIMNQNVWQRIFASERGKEGNVVVSSALAWVPIPAAAGLIGMIGVATGFQGNASNVMPAVILGTLPSYAVVGFAVLILAVILSTIDSCLNSFASIVIMDVYKPYIGDAQRVRSDASLLLKTKVLIVIVGVAIAVIGMAEFSVLFFNYAVGAIAIPLTWPFVLSVLTPRFNRTWGIVGMALGIVAAVLLAFLPAAGLWESPFELWQGYLIAHLVSMLVPLVGTLVSPDRGFSFEEMERRVAADSKAAARG